MTSPFRHYGIGRHSALMPPAYNFVRRAVDTAFTRTRTNLKVVG